VAVRRKSSVRAVSYPRILEFHPPESLNPYPVSAALLTRNMAAPPSSSASSSLPSSSSSSSSSSLSQSTSCTPPTEDRLATPRRITLANIRSSPHWRHHRHVPRWVPRPTPFPRGERTSSTSYCPGMGRSNSPSLNSADWVGDSIFTRRRGIIGSF